MSACNLRSTEVLLDIRHFSQIGCCKPDKTNYKTAVDELGLPPEKPLFVDDVPEKVVGVIELGLNGNFMVCSGARADFGGFEWVSNLEEIESLL